MHPSIASKLLGEALICNLGPGWAVRNSWSLWRFGLSRKALPVPHVNGAGLFPKLVRTVLAFPNSGAKRGLLSCEQSGFAGGGSVKKKGESVGTELLSVMKLETGEGVPCLTTSLETLQRSN